MKNMKKFASLLLAWVMLLAMTVTASAASITIEGGASGSEYAAYKLLDAELPTEGDTSGKYNFSVNDKYLTALQEVTGKSTSDEIVDYIADLTDDEIRGFADAVYAKIKGLTPDYTTDDNVFDNVDMGYYLIAETKVGDTSDTYSLIMLDTAAANEDENITVTTKEDKPTVDKEVEEKNDSEGTSDIWGESADYDIGDTINYKITGTVSSKYEDYLSYYYSFSDTMDGGLTLNKDSIKVTINGVDVTEQFTIETTEHSFTATANLKELTGVTIEADTKIIVTYTATLNENAVSGAAGNKNEVILKYENDPYYKGDGDPDTPDEPEKPGETPKDINIVFTYDAIVNKVDDKDEPLEGAGFTLYKWVADENNWVAVGDEITGVTTFTFEGLDVGKYKLVETTVPNGYNKAADIIFYVEATYDDTKDPVVLTDLVVKDEDGKVISGENLTFTADKTEGEVETDVVNKAGIELPSTGGMGTTIFYILGGALVVIAVVLLVTKKRMTTEE